MSYNELRKGSKTHFIERHLFKTTESAIEFQLQLSHYFQDAMNTMETNIVICHLFDSEQYHRYYENHLATPAKKRIENLLEHNYFIDYAGYNCKLKHSITIFSHNKSFFQAISIQLYCVQEKCSF